MCKKSLLINKRNYKSLSTWESEQTICKLVCTSNPGVFPDRD